ncbi:FAD-dependent monooxygenase [Streptomyces sp. NPDC059850]|uniref:FAD-dependent monooxygenase n=1 Tax=Streptomyces sp. NPDC059850 TaxID=3346970 RepID=UPI003654D323
MTALAQDTHAVTATVRHSDGGEDVIRARYLVAADVGHAGPLHRSRRAAGRRPGHRTAGAAAVAPAPHGTRPHGPRGPLGVRSPDPGGDGRPLRIDRVFLAGDAAHTRGSGAGLPDRQTRTGPAGHRPHRPNRPHRHRGARTAVAA